MFIVSIFFSRFYILPRSSKDIQIGKHELAYNPFIEKADFPASRAGHCPAEDRCGADETAGQQAGDGEFLEPGFVIEKEPEGCAVVECHALILSQNKTSEFMMNPDVALFYGRKGTRISSPQGAPDLYGA